VTRAENMTKILKRNFNGQMATRVTVLATISKTPEDGL
jgi:hypothetical protein